MSTQECKLSNILGPPIATFVRNCYNDPPRLFVLSGNELLFHEGTAQEDPTTMAVY